MKDGIHRQEDCLARIGSVKDALYAINGKWKLLVVITLIDGPRRFNEIERSIEGITPKVLSKELKDMELNGFVKRIESHTNPVQVTYELTPYSDSLREVIVLLSAWGTKHRTHILEMSRRENTAKLMDK
ncbi:winged helix-turn-helix transcriptional regulator [Chitinophaga barathri]|uniref:Transcriptional regulator n=1 Tax=Chitinophaga barathri TaxID=1647451 RepID=A0A3N4MFB3_9BACT|nr:helix-turn-helix domain-containing protein [Chitinophaga barathri]RPD42288.1 transcriptional regulator [Chitinophaga barathri]